MNQTVYVVDDEVNVRKSTCALIAATTSANVEAYESGESFLENATKFDHACLILDQIMPGLSGLEVLKQLELRNIDLPTILVSGYTSPFSAEETPTNVVGFLSKPCAPEEMVELVKRSLEISGQS